jgi:hypothetical protein
MAIGLNDEILKRDVPYNKRTCYSRVSVLFDML